MDKTRYYIYASREDSQDRHPENKYGDFIVELPETLYLEGPWEIGLLEATYNQNVHKEITSPMGTDILMFCDLCRESFVRGKRLPILRKLEKSRTFEAPIFKRVKSGATQRIRLYMTDYDLNPISISAWKIKCTLVLRRCQAVYKEPR